MNAESRKSRIRARHSSACSRGGRPRVFINMSMTADGKIATMNRGVSSFGSRHDHRHLLELRATADAVLAGARTVDSSAINLGPGSARYRQLRRARGLAEYNLRVIASRRGTVDPKAEVFRHRFSEIIILTTEAASRLRVRRLQGLGAVVKTCGTREIDWEFALGWLHAEYGVNRLLCEGGGELNEALFRASVVDEVHLTVCPFIFGGREAPSIAHGESHWLLSQAIPLRVERAGQSGAELFLVFRRDRPLQHRNP